MDYSDLIKKAAQLRVDTLTAINKAGFGYSGSSMSLMEILVTLYYGSLNNRPVFKYDVVKPDSAERDYLVLSKGHAAVALYSVLADKGFFHRSEMDYIGKLNSLLQTSPNIKVPGITAPVAYHGEGLSIACGIAMSLKMDRKLNHVFAILGDGELEEGQIWEAAMSAVHYKLNNLIAFIDNDDLQMDGPVRAVMDIGFIQSKFDSFGWKVIQVHDGHDFDQLLDALNRAFTSNRQPVCIWCHTTKGKGIPFAEGKVGYHDVPLSDAELSEVISYMKSLYE